MRLKYLYIGILLAFVTIATNAQETTNIIHDNSGGTTARITFRAEVVKLMKIENDVIDLNIGTIEAGKTVELGPEYKAVFHLTGEANSKFVINLLSDDFSSGGLTLNGVKWLYRSSQFSDYTQIMSFPFVSQLNQDSGDGWIMVYPESVTADQTVENATVYFEFKFNCSYYEL